MGPAARTQPAARGGCNPSPPRPPAPISSHSPYRPVPALTLLARGGARRPPPPPSSRQARRRARPRSASATTTTMTTTTTRRARPSRRPPPSTASSRSRSSRCYFTYATAPQLVAATHLRSCSHPQEHPKETAPTLGYTKAALRLHTPAQVHLRHNVQQLGGVKDELVERCADLELCAPPPPPPPPPPLPLPNNSCDLHATPYN